VEPNVGTRPSSAHRRHVSGFRLSVSSNSSSPVGVLERLSRPFHKARRCKQRFIEEHNTQYRKLGNTGLTVSEIGFGTWGMGGGWGPHDDAEHVRALQLAFELGVTFFDTARVSRERSQ